MKNLILFFLSFVAISVSAQSLRGSGKSQKIQNRNADSSGLSRIKNEPQLDRMENRHFLVPITSSVDIDSRLKDEFRYCRPWVNNFLNDMQKAFSKKFGGTLKVNSAVRTLEYQKALRKKNKNAAVKSSHPTGSTIDIAKLGCTKTELKWMRKYLLSLEKSHLIEATEERKQLVFHIMVFKKYHMPKQYKLARKKLLRVYFFIL